MADRHQGRWTAHIDGDFVVFIIGAKVRNPIKAMKALPLLGRMNAMLKELAADPTYGLLGYQRHGGPFGVFVQYWRSYEALDAYARNPAATHAKTWREWYRLGQHKNGAAGIWHETYKVRAGEYEVVYQNMPAIGLAAAGETAPVGASAESAGRRIGVAEPTDAPARPVA